MSISNLLSIDVEDYFQVSAFENISPPSSWDSKNCRVEENTDRILQILEDTSTKATFFVLGWIAELFPSLVRSIATSGHEVASHGYWHQRICCQKRQEFREDIRSSKALLEDLIGKEVVGYRAPSYSISAPTFWAFDELLEAGYLYDSSIFPIKHDFYGVSDWSRFSGRVTKNPRGNWNQSDQCEISCPGLLEVPITTLSLFGKNMPIAGGGYFRLFPYTLTRWGLKQINDKEGQPFIFYLHPWELDPQQPRMHGASLKGRFRHYLNLDKTESRFKSLIRDFTFSPVCRQFENELSQELSLRKSSETGKMAIMPASSLAGRVENSLAS